VQYLLVVHEIESYANRLLIEFNRAIKDVNILPRLVVTRGGKP
jgi:hypothetical protein